VQPALRVHDGDLVDAALKDSQMDFLEIRHKHVKTPIALVIESLTANLNPMVATIYLNIGVTHLEAWVEIGPLKDDLDVIVVIKPRWGEGVLGQDIDWMRKVVVRTRKNRDCA
jgi:hypothetical protein